MSRTTVTFIIAMFFLLAGRVRMKEHCTASQKWPVEFLICRPWSVNYLLYRYGALCAKQPNSWRQKFSHLAHSARSKPTRSRYRIATSLRSINQPFLIGRNTSLLSHVLSQECNSVSYRKSWPQLSLPCRAFMFVVDAHVDDEHHALPLHGRGYLITIHNLGSHFARVLALRSLLVYSSRYLTYTLL
jgi:hypothetical protein